jgi:serine/threonine-protein kinase RsbW
LSAHYQITRAAEFESLAAFRELIDMACREQTGIDESTRYDLKLAVDEACTNVITHGYAGLNPGSIIFSIDFEPDQVTLTLTDFGHAFEPAEAPQPDVGAALEDQPTGGFGLFFIYQTMDEVNYQATDYGNHLTLVKRLSPTQAA